jgi:hypothetical protein
MTRKRKHEVQKEELERQDGEELPEREVMSIVAVDPQPIEITPVEPGEPPDTDPKVGPPEDTS